MSCASNGRPRIAYYTQRAIELYFIMSPPHCPSIMNPMGQHSGIRVIGKLNYSPPNMMSIAMPLRPYVHTSS